MPFVSEAQRRKFNADPRLHKYLAEYNASTPKGKLPQHKKGKHHAQISRFVKKHGGK
jgi:hypothetical protein